MNCEKIGKPSDECLALWYLLGLFEPSHMQYESDRDKDMEPSIAEMTRKAIEILSQGPDGYFLMVEGWFAEVANFFQLPKRKSHFTLDFIPAGARIDLAHHDSKAQKALEDTAAFDDAVKVAVENTDEKDTLIIVTADHAHVFNMGGYTGRGNDILGKRPF